MYLVKNLVEYYDELFPLSEAKKNFFLDYKKIFPSPLHFLSIQCGSGLLENILAKQGHDVTGIENSNELLNSASLRRRNQLMFIRFFQMPIPDITKFLGKSFYNVIYILNNRLMFFPNLQVIQNFMNDAKKLLVENGELIFEIANFEKYGNSKLIKLPTKESIRSKLWTEIFADENNNKTINVHLENSSNKILPILSNYPVNCITATQIEHAAEKAGFSSANFYADFEKNTFHGNEDSFIVILK